ncbi:putative GCN5-related N-acetyltransferase [Actinoplanes missouriensis 431]|uniref:Putative GCN5-related N-acetyltransferase n=1 Tax=Actinoplanes missouriensis (strain ATCC 14538 / DSM 43046 / CBS 188.64 / JCM 3121 / NBRC 102363 / NCIMB 12654 / NRRL B-3342 / UNCC 431) TaxID=512565 RepID=I0HAP6_ACTM4|nr:GNAT family N-acetyltransferase [Actinoplanes missouriensis]BAL90083.1 putative GCN5-related N-acetyltransferase [Actinoplanes missouriensis 431]
MSDLVIRAIRQDEIPAVGAMISNAFDDLAANHYLVPVAAERENVMAGFFTLESETAFRQGRIEVIDHPDGGYAAAAVWFDRETDLPEAEAYMERLEAIAGEHFERFGALGELFEKNHPTDAHWHLAFLGVRPSEQGRGLGGALMQRVHDDLDAKGVPAYLEATNENNVRLYRRYGYQPMDPCEIYLPDGTAFYRMWRPAS